MPWQTDGRFIRVNPQFSGADVWQKDQQAVIKIIATRHDYHDEDLAQGIADCLNLDGYNAMRADLDMGGFNIINVGGGGGGVDVIERGVWSPVLVGTTPTALSSGMWQRVDDVVTVFGDIRWSAIVTNSIPLTITGFPYSIAPDANGNGKMFVSSFMAWDDVDLSGILLGGGSSTDQYIPQVFTRSITRWSNTEARLVNYFGQNNLVLPNIVKYPSTDDINPNGEISFSFTYITDQPFNP